MKDYEKMVKEMKNFETFQTAPSQLSAYVNAGWRNPGDDLTLKNKTDKVFEYTIAYKDEAGKKFFKRDFIKAEDA
jgi:hypothetical protein